jgi:hypothetical protein
MMHAQAAMQLPPGGGSGNSIGSGAENTVGPVQVELGGRPAKGGGLLSDKIKFIRGVFLPAQRGLLLTRPSYS